VTPISAQFRNFSTYIWVLRADSFITRVKIEPCVLAPIGWFNPP